MRWNVYCHMFIDELATQPPEEAVVRVEADSEDDAMNKGADEVEANLRGDSVFVQPIRAEIIG